VYSWSDQPKWSDQSEFRNWTFNFLPWLVDFLGGCQNVPTLRNAEELYRRSELSGWHFVLGCVRNIYVVQQSGRKNVDLTVKWATYVFGERVAEHSYLDQDKLLRECLAHWALTWLRGGRKVDFSKHRAPT
jgi:hypothetical protein